MGANLHPTNNYLKNAVYRVCEEEMYINNPCGNKNHTNFFAKHLYIHLAQNKFPSKANAESYVRIFLCKKEIEIPLKNSISEFLFLYGDTPQTRVDCCQYVDTIEKMLRTSFDAYDIGLFTKRTVKCLCGAEAVPYEDNTYGREVHGIVYKCPQCDTFISREQLPLGTDAKEETVKYRQFTHYYLDKRMQLKGMSYDEAYDWLSKKMKMDKENCHIGNFTEKECKTALAIIGKCG